MTREERLKWLKQIEKDIYVCSIESDLADDMKSCIKSCAIHSAIEELEQEPCEDAISRQAVDELSKELVHTTRDKADFLCNFWEGLRKIPPVTPKPKTKTVYCKECKYFEYDSVAKVDGIPLIVAHEICKKWGDGCKTSEDGYCFLFEPQESEE